MLKDWRTDWIIFAFILWLLTVALVTIVMDDYESRIQILKKREVEALKDRDYWERSYMDLQREVFESDRRRAR